MKTDFALPDRITSEEAYENYKKIVKNKSVINIIQAIPEVIIILNKFRQIVFANNTFLKLLNKKDVKEVLGLRPGEAVKCVHSDLNEAGCGTSKFCRYCGAVRAILDTINGKEGMEECKILTKDNRCLLLRVKTVPVEIDNVKYTLFTMRDIRDEKAMKEYQKILFIDINEILSEILVAVEVLKNNFSEDIYIDNVLDAIENAISIIEKQKLLISAENNEISVYPVYIYTKDFLLDLKEETEDVEIDSNADNVEVRTDFKLLSIVMNSLIIAAKTFQQEGKIILSCKCNKDNVEFYVKCNKYIPPEIQYNIFKKSLLTKESPAEIETYLAKILTEWYLNGSLTYTTDEKKGTTFILKLDLIDNSFC